jgi:hypothetical protein
MTRRITDPDDRPQDRPGFNRLHYICQLWVGFLTAADEAQKHKILYETVSHVTLYRAHGAEGEDVIRQVWEAVRRRGRVFDDARHWAEARDDGGCSQMYVPRPYPFIYQCGCGHQSQVFFPDINHIDQIVPCGKCSANVKIGLDIEALELRESQDGANDRALTAQINATASTEGASSV